MPCSLHGTNLAHICLAISEEELRKRARIFKDMQEIRLWCSITKGVLYVHDYHDHEKCIIIAIQTAQESWSIRLDPKSFGHKLILDVVSTVPEAKIIYKLHVLYERYGCYT